MQVRGGRIAAIRRSAPRGARTISVRGAYVAPGFIDLHVWGPSSIVSREAVKGGTTAFLTTLGPEARETLIEQLSPSNGPFNVKRLTLNGARCLGLHLEGPFLNPARAGALPTRWMRRPTVRELAPLAQAAGRRLKVLTIAPELPGALDAIRWCRRRGIAVSLGHSDADADIARRAVDAGACAVTHVFNGMRPFHHRRPGLLDAALTDERLTTMVIADGVHVSPSALQLLVHLKGAERIALVTDSIRHQPGGARSRRGAFYARKGVLAGSRLTMIDAVRNAVQLAGASLAEAVRMATATPARLLGVARSRGTLEAGKRADLVMFDRRFQVVMTFVDGKLAYQRKR